MFLHTFFFSKITAFCGQRVELSSNDWPFWKILKIDWLLDTQRQYEYSIRPTEYPCLSCSTSYYVRVDYSTCTYRRLQSILCLLYLRKNGDAVFLKISTELPVLKYQRSILDDVGSFALLYSLLAIRWRKLDFHSRLDWALHALPPPLTTFSKIGYK